MGPLHHMAQYEHPNTWNKRDEANGRIASSVVPLVLVTPIIEHLTTV